MIPTNIMHMEVYLKSCGHDLILIGIHFCALEKFRSKSKSRVGSDRSNIAKG